MKRLIFLLSAIFICTFAYAETININWESGDTTYETSTCAIGGDLIVPQTPPTKTGYTFVGWEIKPAKELQYVNSPQFGYQYINTGIKFDSNEIEYETKLSICNNYKIPFGAVGTTGTSAGTTQNSSGSLIQTGSYKASFSAGSTVIASSIDARPVHEYNLYINKRTKTLRGIIDNDTEVGGTISGTITSDKDIILGSIRAENFYSYCGNIYYFRIKKDGVLVLDLIPAKDPDGVVCFYDRVSKTFFYNQYGANFTAGPEVQ